jgi:hypothetical protein
VIFVESQTKCSNIAQSSATIIGLPDSANLLAIASPMVTVGFMCAPPIGPATVTATKTANAHPAVIIHPELLPLVFFRTTFATTRYLVNKEHCAIISATNGVIFLFRDKLFFNQFPARPTVCSSF